MRNMSCVLFHEENNVRINSDLPLALGLSLPVRAPRVLRMRHMLTWAACLQALSLSCNANQKL